MITATLNGRPLYAKGTMDVKMFDPATNDLVYYSNKMSTSQLASATLESISYILFRAAPCPLAGTWSITAWYPWMRRWRPTEPP